jgi:hypothetical protein
VGATGTAHNPTSPRFWSARGWERGEEVGGVELPLQAGGRRAVRGRGRVGKESVSDWRRAGFVTAEAIGRPA